MESSRFPPDAKKSAAESVGEILVKITSGAAGVGGAEMAEGHDVIGIVSSDGGIGKPSMIFAGAPITAATIDQVQPSGFGQTLHRLAEIDCEISAQDLDDFVQGEILN
jgi:hypothetical protein